MPEGEGVGGEHIISIILASASLLLHQFSCTNKLTSSKTSSLSTPLIRSNFNKYCMMLPELAAVVKFHELMPELVSFGLLY